MSDEKSPLFETIDDYRKWIYSQSWYQTIELSNGLKTPGKFPTYKRIAALKTIDFEGRSVLDVGCNSGQYSLFAKQRGASSVLGIDVDKHRLSQARILAKNEKLDVEFRKESLFELSSHQKFDIVLCVAVLTEIPDLFGAVEKLKQVIGGYAFVELDIAKPLLYLSSSKNWIKRYDGLSRRTAISEVRKLKDGRMVFSPSFEVLEAMFGEDFKLSKKRGGVRYDLVEVRRGTP